MQLIRHLEACQVLAACSETDGRRLLQQLASALLSPRVRQLNPGANAARILEAVVDRADARVTAVGSELAFPHARVSGFCGLGIALAILRNPVDLGGLGRSVRFVCLIVAPEEAPMVTLTVMSRLAGFFRDEGNRRALLAAASGQEAVARLAAGELSLELPITARDIMVHPAVCVRVDTPLREVARTLHAHHLETVAVTDEDGRLVGEITANGLFQFGLPEFFQHLKSVSFISEFDPFEKYFEREARSVAGQLMNERLCLMRPESTLLEIVFALAVQRVAQVYVADADGQWLGLIDRAAVLNNVINW